MKKLPTDGIRISAEAFRTFIAAMFTKVSVPPNHATLVAKLIVDKDLRGVVSHGVGKVPWYVEAFRWRHSDRRHPRPGRLAVAGDISSSSRALVFE